MLSKILKSLPFRLFFCVVIAFCFAKEVGEERILIFYTISCIMKEILMFLLPVIIFSYIFSAIISLERNAPKLILLILILVTISNGLSSITAYFVGRVTLPFISLANQLNFSNIQEMQPLWSLGIKSLISSDQMMFSAIILGMIFYFKKNEKVEKFSVIMQNMVNIFLKKCFIPCLPIYVLGFVLKMQFEGMLTILFENYAQVFILICLLIIAYIASLYLVAANFSLNIFKKYLKSMFVPGLTGFTTISSAVTMPVTITAVENNTGDKAFARMIIPSTVNIHMIGHGLSIPVTALSILLLSGQAMPDITTFVQFVLYFCIAKFSASAVPGGGIIVILPILQSQLGFSAEMCSIIIMLDILQDAVLTSANVMGNGAFAIIAHKIYKRLFRI